MEGLIRDKIRELVEKVQETIECKLYCQAHVFKKSNKLTLPSFNSKQILRSNSQAMTSRAHKVRKLGSALSITSTANQYNKSISSRRQSSESQSPTRTFEPVLSKSSAKRDSLVNHKPAVPNQDLIRDLNISPCGKGRPTTDTILASFLNESQI